MITRDDIVSATVERLPGKSLEQTCKLAAAVWLTMDEEVPVGTEVVSQWLQPGKRISRHSLTVNEDKHDNNTTYVLALAVPMYEQARKANTLLVYLVGWCRGGEMSRETLDGRVYFWKSAADLYPMKQLLGEPHEIPPEKEVGEPADVREPDGGTLPHPERPQVCASCPPRASNVEEGEARREGDAEALPSTEDAGT